MTDGWTVIATFTGNAADFRADMIVSCLNGNGIKALRIPGSAWPRAIYTQIEPIRVLVPPDKAQQAEELLEEIENADPETE